MIHTFELSAMVSADQYEQAIKSLEQIKYMGTTGIWITKFYTDKGFSHICLYKFNRKKNDPVYSPDSKYYMITLTINPGTMFGDEGNFANNIQNFGDAYIKSIYYNIYELLPFLETSREYRYSPISEEREVWYEYNTFKLRRIDFTFDIKSYADFYLSLIDKGYTLRNSLKRQYYEDELIKENLADIDDDFEPEFHDDEFLLPDKKYVYYKSKSLNINVYNKEYALKNQQPDLANHDYDFLRIEFQIKKNKLNAIKKRFNLPERDLRYFATPEIEHYILESYIKALTGTGCYCTLQFAYTVIDKSLFKPSKKERLKKLLYHISRRKGIAKTLSLIENGTITDVGKLSTVKTYLKEISALGINPLTLPESTEIPEAFITDLDESAGPILPSLLTIVESDNTQTLNEIEEWRSLDNANKIQ